MSTTVSLHSYLLSISKAHPAFRCGFARMRAHIRVHIRAQFHARARAFSLRLGDSHQTPEKLINDTLMNPGTQALSLCLPLPGLKTDVSSTWVEFLFSQIDFFSTFPF